VQMCAALAEWLHCGGEDRQTDNTKLIATFRSLRRRP